MDDIEILRSRLEDKAREEISFDPNYVISVLDGWRYSTEAQSTYNWRYNLNPTWQTYVPGTFPNVASNTRYYALSITVPPMTSGYSTFELGLYSREGVVGYINGEEVVRKNLPAGPVSADTQANKIDETSSFLRVVSSRRVFMSGASVLVAVEIHKDVNNTTPYTDDFKAYLIPHQQAKDYRVADGSAVCTTTSPTNEHVNNLFDNNKGTEWSAYTDPSIVITYTFNNKRREWFNQYTLTSSSSNPEYDPMTWRVEGSNDGLTWNRIDYQSNFLFTGRRQTATFKVASNRVSYSEVRFAIVATRDTTSNMARLAEIRLFATTDEVMDSNLVYDAENVVYVVGITENFAVKPKSSGFQSFAINPALPAGISIDEDSGVISGSTTETTPEQVTYTVTAMSSVEGITREAHVPMTFRVCDEATSTRIDIMKHNMVGSYKESWELVCQDEVIAQSTGLDSTETQIVHACVRRGICWIHMKDSLGDAWNAGAYLEVTLYNKGTPYKLGKTYVADSDSSSVAINTDFYVSEKSDITKVYTGLEYKPSWYADQAFVTSASWSPITGVNVTSPRRHWYVYTSVTQPLTRTNAHSYVVRFYCRAGVILYVNGQEKYRLNVDDATVTESTMITGGSSVPYWHTFTGPLSDLTDASNVFAFDVVNAEVEATVDFDMFVYISGSSSMMSLTEDVMTETSASSGSYSVKRIADGNWWSYALIPRESRTDSQWVGIKYKNDGRRYVNVYCVTCNPEFSRYDPTEWDFIASNDEKLAVANWTVIDSRTNVRFSKREQRLCYSITTPSAFNIYRLVMKANRNIYPSNAFAVSELELYHYDVFTQPALKYQMSEIQGYVNMPIPTLTTTASIGTVTVSPPLPAGISLNPYTGRISGTPTEANTGATTSYVFTNTRGTVTETTTVVIRIDTCAEPKQPFYIHVPTAGAMGPQLSFNVTAGNSTVLSVAELPLHVEMYYPLCMEPTTIGLTLGSTGNSWGMYYAEVMTEDLFVVGRTTYATDVAFTFYPFYTIRPSSDWKLLYGAVPDNSWKNSDFLDSTWQQLKPEAFPTLSNAAQYYRKTFTVASVDSAATVYYKFRVSAGLIAYLNGKEIYRTNIPNGAVTSETYASTEYLTPQTITGTIVLEKDTFTNGTNILAVETHSVAVPKTTKNVFSATLLIADYMTYTLLEGSPSADIDDGGIHGLSKAFDQMTSTSYESGPRCESAYMQWTYPMGSRYVVNSYTVNSSFGNCPNRFPTSWVVEGTNDGLSWSMVDYMPETITYSSTAVVTRDFYPTRNFNSYRLRVTSCKNMATSEECEAGLTINEFAMYQKKVNFEQVCQGDLRSRADQRLLLLVVPQGLHRLPQTSLPVRPHLRRSRERVHARGAVLLLVPADVDRAHGGHGDLLAHRPHHRVRRLHLHLQPEAAREPRPRPRHGRHFRRGAELHVVLLLHLHRPQQRRLHLHLAAHLRRDVGRQLPCRLREPLAEHGQRHERDAQLSGQRELRGPHDALLPEHGAAHLGPDHQRVHAAASQHHLPVRQRDAREESGDDRADARHLRRRVHADRGAQPPRGPVLRAHHGQHQRHAHREGPRRHGLQHHHHQHGRLVHDAAPHRDHQSHVPRRRRVARDGSRREGLEELRGDAAGRVVPRVPERESAHVGQRGEHVLVPAAHHLLQPRRHVALQERPHDADGADHPELHHELERLASAACGSHSEPQQRLHHRHAHGGLRAGLVHRDRVEPEHVGPDGHHHHRHRAALPHRGRVDRERAGRESGAPLHG